jgi:hypothetical protein
MIYRNWVIEPRGMKRRILNTVARQKLARARDRDTKLLKDRGWTYDGLWHYSPYTGNRYMRREALHIEELRAWGEGDSAFLNDKDHSMWVKKEQEDNKLLTFEELAEQAALRAEAKQEASNSNFR